MIGQKPKAQLEEVMMLPANRENSSSVPLLRAKKETALKHAPDEHSNLDEGKGSGGTSLLMPSQ